MLSATFPAAGAAPRLPLRAMAADNSRAALDIHETAGDSYKNAVRETFLWCADEFANWIRMPCLDADGARLSKQQLHEALYAALAPEFVNRAVA